MSKALAPAIDTSRHQERFLECFAACGSVLKAARSAKLNRQSHYWWLREDPTYRPRFEAACERVAQMLEDEAVRRAHDGVRRAVRYKGKVVGYEMEYSDRLLELLLKAHSPEKYAERSKVNLNVTGELELRARLEAGRKRAAAECWSQGSGCPERSDQPDPAQGFRPANCPDALGEERLRLG
jgi:hypothetical protein